MGNAVLKLNLFSLALLLSLPNAPAHAQGVQAPESQPGCHFGEIIDGTTADDARKHIEVAGYTAVRDLKKSCDNFWHGRASINGVETNVLVTPDGHVRPEGN